MTILGPSADLELDEKVASVFGELAIDKRRLPSSQLKKKGVPAYVAEWLLESLVPGVGELTPAEHDKVKRFTAERMPGATEQEVVKARLARGETIKVLTPVQVEVKLAKGKVERLACLRVIGLDDVHVSDGLLEVYPDLLRQGLWGVVEIALTAAGLVLQSFRPMQATVSLELFKKARAEFTISEWKDLLLTSMGYSPAAYSEAEQLVVLTRLLPLVQKNMHLMELAPKGTGKSYFFENVSPRVRVVSGGNVSPAVLFVNNASGQWGMLARFAVVVLDEVQNLKFERPEEIVGALKGYLANGKLTRGGLHEVGSDCGLVLLANIGLDENQRPLRESLVDELPGFLRETAFIDRLKGIIPGWKCPKLSGNSFAEGLGLKSDFFGDALLALRDDLTADQLVQSRLNFTGTRTYARNDTAVRDISAGMLKILFPHGIVTPQELRRFCVKPALELRQLVWDQLYMRDGEYRQYERDIECEVRT